VASTPTASTIFRPAAAWILGRTAILGHNGQHVKTSAAYKFLPPELAERLRNLGLAVRKPVEGAVQGLHKSPHLGASVEFAEYRNYVPGDAPDLIDWAVYARSDRYMIRRYREETNVRAYVLLDCSESLAFKDEGLYTKFDYACYVAAGLMFILLNQGDAAGLISFRDGLVKSFPPAGSFESLRPLLLHLEELQPTGMTNIEAALHQTAELINRRSLIILISDLLQNPAEVLRGIHHLQHDGHDVTVLHTLDPGELRLTFTGHAELRELETRAKMVIEADEIKDAYAREVDRYLTELRQGCAQTNAEYHLVNTRHPIEEAIQLRATRA